MDTQKYKNQWRALGGTVSGVTLAAFGGILTFSFAVAVVCLAGDMVTARFTGELWQNGNAFAVCLLFLLLSLVITVKGFRLYGRSKRFKRYQEAMGDNQIIAIDDLVLLTHKSQRYIMRDLKKMIDKGLFTDAFLDQKQRRLILGRENYEPALARAKQAGPQLITNTGNKDIDTLAAEGNQYLQQIQAANKGLQNPQLSAKVDRIAVVSADIFAAVAEKPQKAGDIRQFMQYYLPVTLKLLKTYNKLKSQTVAGENITSAMRDIEMVLGTVVQAFEKLLDNLFRDEALDIATDITVLEGMLSREGLTGQDFEMKS